MKLIVAGGREFCDFILLSEKINEIYGEKIKEIVSGTARGADSLGEMYARKHKIPIKRFPADWNKNGKSAGYIRNKQMAEYGTHLLAFWDGESRGTKMMIDIAKKKGLDVNVVRY